MKITCTKSELMNGINIALRAVPSKSVMPILESFLIAAKDDITITSNDNDMGIRTGIEGVVLESGMIAVEARLFSDIIRKLPENELTIESNASYKIRISCEGLEFHLNGNNPDEFPELPETGTTRKVTMSEFTLKEMIRQTIFSIAVNDSNALMKGELFSIKGDNLKVVSLDSHRISIRNEKLALSYDNSDVIVPGKTLNEISRILSGNSEDMVELEFDKRFIKFSFNKTLVISRLIEGEFFDVERMISSDYASEVRVNRNDFMNNIDRAITLTREGDKKPVVLEIRDSFINMDITSSLGSMSGRIDANKTGDDIVIGFNPKFLMDALRVIDDEEVAMYFVNSNAPCFIRNDAGEYVYIILPVNINR
ncbi:MAG: DNA polymerase III subunit beta [Parasporobacterium sp.]|nr:DNA polymerase III subunit beta [Parasporobacterium sp.]MBR3401782.1 DNA polymerase III subunit beta [Parasporobacterium sp.]